MEDIDIRIERHVAIIDGSNQPWHVKPTIVDGYEFVAIDRANRGLHKFLHGKSIYKHTPWLDQLKQRRAEASLNLVPSDDSSLFENRAGSVAVRKAQKKECQRMQALGTLPGTVMVSVPAERGLPPVDIRCITSLDPKALLHVEITAEVLAYIKAAACMEPPDEPLQRKRKSGQENVYWATGRNTWVAWRTTAAGVRKYKSFRPQDGTDDAESEAAELAGRWARQDGGDVSGEEDEDKACDQEEHDGGDGESDADAGNAA